MRCEVVTKSLDLFLTQTLAPALRDELESHLASCTACRERLERLERLAAVFAADARILPVPAGFRDRVMSRAQDRTSRDGAIHRPARTLRDWWASLPLPVRVGWAASLAAGLLIGTFLGRQTWNIADQGSTLATSSSRSDTGALGELDYLTDSPGDPLAQTFLALTRGETGKGI
jgi:anti-sigma factor RsiW